MENIITNAGVPENYRQDRGGITAYPFCMIGIVKSTADLTRTGTIKVYLKEFSGPDPSIEDRWKPVRYVSPFYGVTPGASQPDPVDKSYTNKMSYGFWFTAPDVGTQVVVFFIDGDPDKAIYMGGLPDEGAVHMLPGIGAGKKGQEYTDIPEGMESAKQLPVVEVNYDDVTKSGAADYFKKPRPVQRVVAAQMFQQGTHLDVQRGPIDSHSQRETPSKVFGFSTPGKPVYKGSISSKNFSADVATATPDDLKIIARYGGHSLVMDDGDTEDKGALTRIRSAKGHQIMMHDEGDFVHIIHANGQSWLELGREGTLEVFTTNSINMRTQGTVNIHADQDINFHAGGGIFAYAKTDINLQADAVMNMKSKLNFNVSAGKNMGLAVVGKLTMQSKGGGWGGGPRLDFTAGTIGLNSGSPGGVPVVPALKINSLPDVKYQNNQWVIVQNALKTICARAPTHEPYPFHCKGCNQTSSVSQ